LSNKQGSNKNIHQQSLTTSGTAATSGGGVGGAVKGEETKKKKGRKRKSTTNNTEGIISLPGGMLSNKHSTSTKSNKTKSSASAGVKGNKNSGKGAKGQLQQPSHVPSASAINLLLRKDVLMSKLNNVLVDRENKKRRLLQEHEDGAKVKEKEKGDGNMDKREGQLGMKGQCELQKSGDKEQFEGAKLLQQQGDVRNDGMNVDAAEGNKIQPQLLTTSKSTDDLAAATANIMSNNDDISDKQNDTTTTTDKKKFQGPLQLRGPSSLETSIIKATDATLSQINNELLSRGSIELSQIASSSSSTLHKSSIGSMYQRLYTISTSTPDPTKSTIHQQQCRLPIRNKTIWDNVLEEMKWMAIDYIEERKWKVAMSKSLCDSVKEKVRENRKKISSPSKRVTTPGGTVVRGTIGTTPESTTSNRSRSKSRSLSILSNCQDTDPIYIESTKEDISNIKKISRLLSVSVLDHWDTSISGSAAGVGGGMESERFRKLRSGALSLDNNGGGDENADNNNSAMDIVKSDTGDTSTAEPESPTVNNPPTYKQLTNDEISTHIKTTIDHINKLKEQTNNVLKEDKALQKYKKSMPTIGSNGGKEVEVDNGQLCAVHFLESLWNESGNSTSGSSGEQGTTAAIVGGRFGSGKTLTVCTLLWKKSMTDGNSGPQLIVCSPGALVRWKHELTKFDGLKPHVYGIDSVNGSGNEYGDASGVVVCDYTSLMKLASNNHSGGKGINFSSMILDLRHPSSTSSPIGNVKWWISLNKFILKCPSTMNRLVIEQTDLPQNCFFHSNTLDEEESSGKKRIDEMLAMKVAFLYHPSTFFAESGSVGKRVISWAKVQAKTKTDSPTDATAMVVDGEEGNESNGNGKLMGCRSVLVSSLQGIIDNRVNVTEEDEVEANSHAWEVHTCTLGRSQQAAYDQCATTLIQGDYGDDELAHHLMRLRKICIHSNLDDVTASLHALSCSRGSISATIGSILVNNSTTFSESNIDLAKSVIKQSSKMKALLHALITECCHTVAMKHELLDTQTTDGADNDKLVEESSTKKAKVLILATLVEAQLLTSFFLSAVGLQHEVLVSSSTGGDGPRGSGSVQAWDQDILSRFNGGVKGSIDILIASPKSVSSQNGGMSVTSADVVISIDEDWSGREALHITSILSKIRRQESSLASEEATTSCRFIKLICLNTCEGTFICQGNTTTKDVDEAKPPEKKTTTKRGGKAAGGRKSRKSSRSSKSNQDETKMDVDDNGRKVSILKAQKPVAHEPVNADGFLIPPSTDVGTSSDKINEHIFGANVVRHKNSKMSLILGFSSTEESNDIFLPAATSIDSGKGEGVTSCNRDFAWALFNAEDNDSNHKPLVSTSSSLIGSKSVQSYVESFGRSFSFTSQAQSGMPLRLWDVQANDKASASNEDAPPPEASNIDDEVAQIDTNNPELLVYRQLKKPDIDLEVAGGDRPSVFSQSFSSFGGSESIAVQDGNQGCEPTLYFPPFLPSLLQVTQHLMTSLPQEGLSGMKRKAVQGDIDIIKSNKKFKVSSSSSAAVTLFSDASSLQKKRVDLPSFSFTVETNPHSFKGDQNDLLGNAELNFHRKLLSSDLRGALSCQDQPSLNSMLLIIKKEQPKSSTAADKESATGSNNNGKKTHKKVKKQQLLPSSNSLLPQDKSLPAYFGNKYLKPQSYSTREGLKISFTGSLMGRVRHQNRMNDLVSNSLSQSDDHKPAVLGTIPCAASGVQAPQLVKTLSSPLEETTVEPWTSKEDSILQKCVSRYGMNWQLAAYAVSSGESFSSSPRNPERVSRRSASQCQSRWLSLETIDHVLDSLPSVVNISDVRVLPRFGNNQSQESIMCNVPSSMNQEKKEPVEPSVWLGRSSNPPISPIKSSSQQITKEERENVLRRAKVLKEASNKRRVATVPVPSSGHTHPSHSEAVQAARSNMQASGLELPRREMWPIELLEFRKKQKEKARDDEREARRARAAAAAEQAAAVRSSSSSQSQQAPQHHQQHRQQQQSSAQYRPAPTQNTHHPTQQQMMYAHGQQQQQVAYHHPRGAPAVVHHASANVNPNASYQQPRAPPQQHPPQETKRI